MLINNPLIHTNIRSLENYNLDDPLLFFQCLLRCDKRKCENVCFDYISCPPNKYDYRLFPKTQPLSSDAEERLETAKQIAAAYNNVYSGLPVVHITVEYILSKTADKKTKMQYALDCKTPNAEQELEILLHELKHICKHVPFFPIFVVWHFGEMPRGKIRTALPPHFHLLLVAQPQVLYEETYKQAYQALTKVIRKKWQGIDVEIKKEMER